MKFIKTYFDRILWMTLLVFALFLLYKCNGEKNKFKELAAAAETLEAKVKQISADRDAERVIYNKEKREAIGQRELAEVEKGEADKMVKQQQKRIDQLVAIVQNKPTKIDTSTAVLVSAAFKDACDSLPAEIDKLNLALADKDSSINGILDLYNYEIQIRDEELFKEMNYSDSLKVDFVRQTQLLKSALKQGKPRGRLLGGISVLGNQNQFLSGAGVVLAYQSKGGKQYQVSPKFIKVPGAEAEVYYEGSVLFTIFK